MAPQGIQSSIASLVLGLAVALVAGAIVSPGLVHALPRGVAPVVLRGEVKAGQRVEGALHLAVDPEGVVYATVRSQRIESILLAGLAVERVLFEHRGPTPGLPGWEWWGEVTDVQEGNLLVGGAATTDQSGRAGVWVVDRTGKGRLLALENVSTFDGLPGFPPDVPAGAKYDRFPAGGMGPAGSAAFGAILKLDFGGITFGENGGIWGTDGQGPLRLLVQLGDPIPGRAGKTFGSLDKPKPTPNGVFFLAGETFFAFEAFRADFAGAIRAVAVYGDTVAGIDGALGSVYDIVPFGASGAVLRGGFQSGFALFRFLPGGLSTVVSQGESLAGFGLDEFYVSSTLEAPLFDVNQRGDVLLLIQGKNVNNQSDVRGVLFVIDAQGDRRLIFRSRDEVRVENPAMLPALNPALPDDQGGAPRWRFSDVQLSRVALGDGGDAVFLARFDQRQLLATARLGLFHANADGKLRLIAVVGDPVEIGGRATAWSGIGVGGRPGVAADGSFPFSANDGVFFVRDPRAVAPALCGNSRLDAGAGEECDDGNIQASDGCSSLCEVEDECETDQECPHPGPCRENRCEDGFCTVVALNPCPEEPSTTSTTSTSSTTTSSSSTTSTSVPPCQDLADALPDANEVPPSARGTARKLGKLWRKASEKVEKGLRAPARKRAKLFKQARKLLSKLAKKARQADRKGKLGVALHQLEAAVDAARRRVELLVEPADCLR
jgi:cysteine-rich repeat protein